MPIAQIAKSTALTVVKSQITKKVVAAIAGAIVSGFTANAYEKFVIGEEKVVTEV